MVTPIVFSQIGSGKSLIDGKADSGLSKIQKQKHLAYDEGDKPVRQETDTCRQL